MDDTITTIYYLCDEFLQAIRHREVPSAVVVVTSTTSRPKTLTEGATLRERKPSIAIQGTHTPRLRIPSNRTGIWKPISP